MFPRSLPLAIVGLAMIVASALGDTVTVDVAFDRWFYPFNVTPGSRATGSVFGALNSPEFDDRDAQMVFGFNLAEVEIPVGRQVSQMTLRLRTAANDTFIYDPTADALESYLVDGVDADAGRPLEVFGVATRGSFEGLTTDPFSPDLSLFTDADSFSESADSSHASRSVYAADYIGLEAVDVSNNVREQFAVDAWAIGQANLDPGQSVPRNVDFEFVLNLADNDIRAYVDRGVQAGEVFFSMTGLHSASRDGPATFPSFYLDANGLSLGQPAQLDLEFDSIPPLACDFDGDGQCSVGDINLLMEQGNLVDGVAVTASEFDLTGDGVLDTADRDAWLLEFGMANNTGPHPVGDANLDGVVDSVDLDVWTSNQFTIANRWDQGDFNGDGLVDGSDFNLWNTTYATQVGSSRVISAVPEPTLGLWGVCVACCWVRVQVNNSRRSSQNC